MVRKTLGKSASTVSFTGAKSSSPGKREKAKLSSVQVGMSALESPHVCKIIPIDLGNIQVVVNQHRNSMFIPENTCHQTELEDVFAPNISSAVKREPAPTSSLDGQLSVDPKVRTPDAADAAEVSVWRVAIGGSHQPVQGTRLTSHQKATANSVHQQFVSRPTSCHCDIPGAIPISSCAETKRPR